MENQEKQLPEGKQKQVIENIKSVEKAISTAIDDLIIKEEKVLTITEINSALINVMMSFNNTELVQLINE